MDASSARYVECFGDQRVSNFLHIKIPLNMSKGPEYKLEDVAATSVASDKIDETFRSSCIGK